MKVALSLLLSGVLATSVLGDAGSLRENLVDLLSEELEGKKNCRIKYKSKQYIDNECEESQTSKPACSCREACKIWGDPYIAPFFSECFVKAFKKPDHTYNIWTIPKNGNDRDEIKIEGYVNKGSWLDKKYPDTDREWVMEVLVNGASVATAKDCFKNKAAHDTLLTSKEYIVFSDAALKTNVPYEDVKIVLDIFCRRSNDRYGTPHLGLTITSVDYGSKYDIHGKLEDDKAAMEAPVSDFWEASADAGGSAVMLETETWSKSDYVPPETTYYFDADFGVCTDPVKYGDATPGEDDKFDVDVSFTCRKNINSDKGLEVRECSCDTQCAAFGDPWVYSNFDPHFPKPKKGQKKAKSAKPFQIPKNKDMVPFERQLYSFWDQFSIDISIDDCERIDKVIVRTLKEQYKPKSCDNMDPASGSTRSAADYDEIILDAKTLCTSTHPKDATKIVYPPTGKAGLLLGNLGVSDAKGKEQVYLKSETDASLCTGKSLKSVVNLGSVRLVAKCHARKDGTPFFNVCVQREDAVRKYFVEKKTKKGFVPPQNDLTKLDPKAFSTLKMLEQDAKTAGWCVLGDYTKASKSIVDKTQRDHEFRGKADIIRFPADKFP